MLIVNILPEGKRKLAYKRSTCYTEGTFSAVKLVIRWGGNLESKPRTPLRPKASLGTTTSRKQSPTCRKRPRFCEKIHPIWVLSLLAPRDPVPQNSQMQLRQVSLAEDVRLSLLQFGLAYACRLP
jgi:hypothetical protein